MKADDFRWNEWNLEHATKHGCTVEEIEAIIRAEVRGNRVRHAGDRKWSVVARGNGGRMIEVVFIVDEDEQNGHEESIFVIHAMPLTTRRRRG